MLKIRLTRTGKKHQPNYRIVVTPKENAPQGGSYVDLIGTYNPLKGEVKLDNEKALAWLNKGAQPSDRVARLLTNAGVQHKSVVVKHYEPKKEEPKEEVAEAPTEPEAPAEESVESTETTEEAAPTPEETPTEETPEQPAE